MLFSAAPLTGALGAEITGITLADGLDTQKLAALRQAWHEHLVLVFRDQDMQPADLVALARRFGELHIHPFVEGLPGQHEVVQIVKEANETNAWGEGWHSDVSYEDRPSLGSVLYAKEIPPFGGDTLFANMELAYQTLPEETKQRIAGLSATHSSGDASVYSEHYSGMKPLNGAARQAIHPVVRTHPETGRKILFVNYMFTRNIVGLGEQEGRTLLAELIDHSTRPEFTCRIRWAPGTVVMWDNRSVLHNAVTDFFEARGNAGYRRVMQRVTIEGDRPQ